MSSARGSVDPPTITLEDLNGRFDAYEQSIHGNYLFVQSLVNEMKGLILENQRLHQEVKGLSFSLSRKESECMTLTDRLAMQNGLSTQGKFVVVLLDGNHILFSRDLLARGFEGGEEAASGLVALVSKRLGLSHSTKVLIHVFGQRFALATYLTHTGITNKPEAFTDFVAGFNSKEELSNFVDVGKVKEATFSKINDLAKLYAFMPTCQNVVLGASYDPDLMRLLSHLQAMHVPEGKVILLGSALIAPELEDFNGSAFPRMTLRDIFMERKPEIPRMEPGKMYSQVAADGAVPVTRIPTSPSPRNTSSVPAKLQEPELGVWLSVKNLSPRACNMFYLNPMKCSKSDCEYSHDHVLSEIQLAALRFNCKKQVCRSFQASDTCQYGEDCIYGHECLDSINGKCASGKKCKLIHRQSI